MPSIYKVLGQSNPAASTLTTLYTSPAATQSVCSTLAVCNQGVSTLVRVAVRPAGAAIDAAHYIVFDAAVNQSDTLFLTLGVTLDASDVVTVFAGTSTVSFSLFGTQIT